MPRQTEPSANNALGGLLQSMLSRSRVHSENTQAFAGHAGLQPDVLVITPGAAPVVVEAEFEPAQNVEPEAKDRLGLEVAANGRVIEAVIALRYPEDVRQAYDLRAALKSARLSYCVFTEEADGESRFPSSGWLEGSVEDLADMVRLVSVPQRAVDAATNALQEGIDRAARLLDELNETKPGITFAIANLLGMTNVPQTRRMACAIVANALVFHEHIAGMHKNIRPLARVCGPSVANPQDRVLAAWDTILGINYWAIFAIAKDILESLDSQDAARILRQLRDTAQSVNAAGVDNAHDLTGRIFQRLIADRKYLATFYTLPASAALLARLAIAKMEGVDWSDAEAIGRLRFGDFACGTGALLSAVYEQVAARHERAGGNPAKLHRVMMEEVLYGCDVMPSAIHITGSTLSGVEPSQVFEKSRLYTMPYGRQADGSVAIGSLELLQSSSVLTLFNTSDPAMRTGSAGEETATQVRAEVPDEGFDLVIMNPPFTRSTNHGGALSDITNPAFAAFGATRADQTAMGNRIKQIAKGTCHHGNAGVASTFSALANKKVKAGGVIALVLPLVVTTGQSWQKFRRMLADNYTDLTVLSIAATEIKEMSFSADTGLGECLVIARKRRPGENANSCGQYTSLQTKPGDFVHARSLAATLLNGGYIRHIEDGPLGGTAMMVGEELAGTTMNAPFNEDKWRAVRLSDCSVAQTAYALSQSCLWLPGSSTSFGLDVAPLGEVGELGLVDRDINGPVPRGPFDKVDASQTATFPALWNHDAESETRLICPPDSQLIVRQGMEEKATNVWTTASRAHLNRDLRFNSQPLAVAVTEQRSIGGRSWPNVSFTIETMEYAFAIWGNSTLGLLAYWWHSSRQDSGRGSITIRSAETLPVLDFRALTDEQLAKAEAIFDEFRAKELKPAYLADADANRALLDRRVVCDLLGFDEATYEGVRRLAAKWCAEPSVHGGKARPRGAGLVV